MQTNNEREKKNLNWILIINSVWMQLEMYKVMHESALKKETEK